MKIFRAKSTSATTGSATPNLADRLRRDIAANGGYALRAKVTSAPGKGQSAEFLPTCPQEGCDEPGDPRSSADYCTIHLLEALERAAR